MKKKDAATVFLPQFDELSEIHQSPATMYVRTTFWALIFLITPAWAQTNQVPAPAARPLPVTNAVVSTNLFSLGTNVPADIAILTNDTRKPRPVTLDEAIQLAIQHNFDVQIERRAPDIARFTLAASYGVYEPSLNFNYTHAFNSQPGGFTPQGIPLSSTEIRQDDFSSDVGPGLSGYLPTGTRYQVSSFNDRTTLDSIRGHIETFNSRSTISLQQPLLRDFWIDQSRAQIYINRRNVKISEWAFRQQLMLTINAVEQAYYNLIFARENIRVQEKALELVERLLVENRKRVQVGALAPLDEQQAQSQVATTRAQLLDAKRALDAQENILKSLITDKYLEWHDLNVFPGENLLSVPVLFDIPESWRKGLALRPDLQQLKLELEKQDITLKYQKNQLFPGLDLVGSYGGNGLNSSYARSFEDTFSGNNPRYTAGVILNIPLGNRNARNRYKATKAEREQEFLRYKKLEQDILVQIDNAIKLAQTDFARVGATREARAFALAALEAEQKKLENGKSTTFLVLQFQRDLTAASFEAIRALAEYNIALSQLAFQEGTTLERRNITVVR